MKTSINVGWVSELEKVQSVHVILPVANRCWKLFPFGLNNCNGDFCTA